MKKYLSLLLAISILVIGVFGFATMNHGAGHTRGCVASAVNTTPCPENIIEMSVHHIQAFVTFFSVVPPDSSITLFTLLLVTLVVAMVFITKRQNQILNRSELWQINHDPERKLIRPRKITRWLSLFENSPSLHRILITGPNLMNLCKQRSLKTIEDMKSSIRQRLSTLSVGWSLMQTASRQAPITKARPIIFALSTARITSRLTL